MKVFKEPNYKDGFMCPICNTDKKAPVILIGKAETEEDGQLDAFQVHLECLNLISLKDEETQKRIILHAGEIL